MADQFQLVTGGIVSVEDGIKKAEEFAPARKVRVELHFALPEGVTDSQKFLDGVAAQADAKVRELLGQRAVTGRVPSAAPAEANAPKAADVKSGKEALAEAAGVSEAHVAAVTPKKAPKRAAAPKPEAAKLDPAAIVDEEPAAVEAVDEFAVPADEAAKPISDEEMNSVVGKVNAKIKNPVAIRGAIASFKPEDWTKQFTMRDIPQDQRAAFIAKIEALK